MRILFENYKLYFYSRSFDKVDNFVGNNNYACVLFQVFRSDQLSHRYVQAKKLSHKYVFYTINQEPSTLPQTKKRKHVDGIIF